MENNKTQAVIEFVGGKTITLTLRPDAAPISVQNFIELAESGFYDGLCMHRVIPGFMVQGGGMTTDGKTLTPKKAKNIRGEFAMNGHNNPLSHKPGVLSMARANDPNSASSQFFVCVADCAFLDGQYAAFGECADEQSLATAIEISKVKTHSLSYYDDVPVAPVVIKSVRIVRR